MDENVSKEGLGPTFVHVNPDVDPGIIGRLLCFKLRAKLSVFASYQTQYILILIRLK